jgi:SecD/SecF fusion protein
MKSLRSRSIVIALVVASSVILLVPRPVARRAYDPVSGQMRDTVVRRVPMKLGLDLRGGSHFALELDRAAAPGIDCADAIRRAERIVRSRLSEFGTPDAVVQTAGECRLLVELPGELDPARARAIVQRTAFLEFRLVDSENRFAAVLPEFVAAAGTTGDVLHGGALPGEYLVRQEDVGAVQRALERADVRRLLPRGIELHWGTERPDGASASYRPLYAVESRAILTGDALVNATATRDRDTGNPQVEFQLSRTAGHRFGEITAREAGRFLAILLDGRVQSRPAIIRERIGSSGRIELPGSALVDASDLALVLRAGALPVPLRIVDERTIDASLGTDAIRAGVRTSALAVALVVCVMIACYRFCGLLAVAALGLYLLCSIAALATLGFTLTLPGLAGFALSIGMAVDANVLIFERIREELAAGAKVRAAVERGFRQAMSAIVDSNVTTALTALILYRIGTEPVQGFAVTLLIGLCASMFSAIFVTRTLFLIWLHNRPALGALNFATVRALAATRFDFLRMRRWAYAVSGLLLVPGLALLVTRGLSYGIEFTGGALVHIETAHPVSTAVVRSALAAGGSASAEVLRFGSASEYLVRARLRDGNPVGGTDSIVREVRRALDARLGASEYRVVRTEAVGPEVGSELQQRAALAIASSFAGTLLYLAARFEWRFGLAAVVATAHDVLATLAFIRYFDLEVSLVTVAAVLTVLGYSLNDTIVIFDRVREKLRRAPRLPLADVLNAAVNETLPRTVLTAGTTLLAALLLACFAGEVIRTFGLVLSCGVAVGTLSSIYVASPVLLWIDRSRTAAH